MKFGDLLVKLNLVSATDLHDALIVAPQFGLPIGRTLVLSGRLSESELETAIELQTLINQRGWTMEQAQKVAHDVRSGLPIGIALKNAGVEHAAEKTTLGQLLQEAGYITPEQLDTAQKSSYRMGMQLGRVLVLNNAINHQTLAKALNVQTLLRDRKISMTQALQMLKNEAPRSVQVEAQQVRPAAAAMVSAGLGAPPTSGAPGSAAPKNVRFSEFLVLSGLLTEAQMMNLLERSMDMRLSLAETVVAEGTIPTVIFEKATELFNKVVNNEMALAEASDQVHRLMYGEGRPMSGAQQHSMVLGELLKLTGVVNEDDIKEAIELSNKYPSLIGKMLVLSGAIDEATLIASLRCQFLLKHNYISLDEAVHTLQYSTKNKISFDDALEELGLRKPSHNVAP